MGYDYLDLVGGTCMYVQNLGDCWLRGLICTEVLIAKEVEYTRSDSVT